jgi:hypothetical protein
MNPKIEDLIAEYKEKLDEAGATFLLVYAYKTLVAQQDVCQISSNSSKEGIRAILHAILMPTREGLALLERALYSSASAATNTLQMAIDAAQRTGAFADAAKNLFEQLRPYWTIRGWENDKSILPPS